jgi:integrase
MATRRASGEGSVFKRGDGRWVASLQVDGARRTCYGRTRSEAVAKLAELKRQAAGGLPDPGKRTVSDLIEEWLHAAAPTLKPRTLADYRQTARLHVLPTLGSKRLNKLTPDTVQRLYATLQARGAMRAAQKCHALLHRACRMAVLWRWLAENPCDRVLVPKHSPARKTVWSAEQLRAFLEGSAQHWLFPLWLLLVTAGLRSGEARALTWADVDFDANTIHVNKTRQRIDGEWVITTPKTAAGERVVSLPPETMQSLRQQRGRQVLAGLAGDLVFTSAKGSALHEAGVARALAQECVRLGLPRVTPHGLRHLHASLLLAEGLPLPAVSARLGHANTQVTATVYAHALPGQDDGARAIARALGGGR